MVASFFSNRLTQLTRNSLPFTPLAIRLFPFSEANLLQVGFFFCVRKRTSTHIPTAWTSYSICYEKVYPHVMRYITMYNGKEYIFFIYNLISMGEEPIEGVLRPRRAEATNDCGKTMLLLREYREMLEISRFDGKIAYRRGLLLNIGDYAWL